MSQADFDQLEAEIDAHRLGNRTASVAMLAWFLSTVWRMEAEDVERAICDGGGDKGIDALVVDEDLREITILQGKHREKFDAGQGDQELRNLVGAAAYFESADSVDGLLRAKPNQELAQLLARLEIRERVAEGAHATRLVFVTNGTRDRAGRDYVEALAGREPMLDLWDFPRLAPIAARTKRPELRDDQVELVSATQPEVVDLGGGVTMAIGLVPAVELVALEGIEDLSLFDRNVRLGVGKTRINKELDKTVLDKAEHQLFPAYHNGLTLLTNGLTVDARKLHLNGITVVNGCQSLLALYRNRGGITDEMRVMVKVVQLDAAGEITDKITYRTNNQNPVDIRDQRSTDLVQRDLQAQVKDKYGAELAYAVRAGEAFPRGLAVLDNRSAAQLLMAVYLGEPWNAVRKVRLFDDDYRRIFGREVDADRIYLLSVMGMALEDVAGTLRPDLQASFASVRVTLAHILAQVLRQSELGRELLEHPGRWLPDLKGAVADALRVQADSIAKLINSYIEVQLQDKGATFDPKVVFKNEREIRLVERDVLSFTERLEALQKGSGFTVQPVR